MKKLSLKQKFLLVVFCISLVCPVVSGLIIYRTSSTIEQFKLIADRDLPRTAKIGNILSSFRQLRIEVRSLAIRGNTDEDFDLYLKNINQTMKQLLEEKDTLIKMMPEGETVLISKLERAWKDFADLGTEILALKSKGDEESLNKIADLVRVSCPRIAREFDQAVEELLNWQKIRSEERTATAMLDSETTTKVSIFLAVAGIIAALTVGVVFASSISRAIIQNIEALNNSALEIGHKSEDVARVSTDLSEAAVQQAASLQQTVASIDEISAMVSRNSDSAVSSARTSEKSQEAAIKGKEKVEEMISSIEMISSGNQKIISQMQKSNQEISEIVQVIQDIAVKTQVINDIVFQTKLLSFNASVEAARAGEHGKGFAVVAEEVGNLASMSGNAATEISEMLNNSVAKVTTIVDGTKSLMDNLIKQSSENVDHGTMTAKQCAEALDEILINVSSVNDMLKEISSASKEQSQGILEVNKAMTELDSVTQKNTGSANESSKAAQVLNTQVENLNKIVSGLSDFVEGPGRMSVKHSSSTKHLVSELLET